MRLCLFSLLLLIALGTSAEPFVSGTTANGFSFAGRVRHLTTSSLILFPEEGGGRSQLTLPIAGLHSLEVTIGKGSARERLEAVARLRPLLPVMSRCTHEELLGLLGEALGEGMAEEVFAWSEAVAAAEPQDSLRAEILAAVALARLGLWRETERRVQGLNKRIPTLEAPSPLCLLNQRLAERRGDLREARRWARLPELRIQKAATPIIPAGVLPPASP